MQYSSDQFHYIEIFISFESLLMNVCVDTKDSIISLLQFIPYQLQHQRIKMFLNGNKIDHNLKFHQISIKSSDVIEVISQISVDEEIEIELRLLDLKMMKMENCPNYFQKLRKIGIEFDNDKNDNNDKKHSKSSTSFEILELTQPRIDPLPVLW
jgi:uncharacterized DUF497 family protein